MHDFERLEAWQLAHQLGIDAYQITQSFPSYERYGLANQIRRSAVSVSANIAEGAGIGGRSFVHHLKIAAGSCSELQAETYLARDLGYVSRDSASTMATATSRVRRVIYGLIHKLSE